MGFVAPNPASLPFLAVTQNKDARIKCALRKHPRPWDFDANAQNRGRGSVKVTHIPTTCLRVFAALRLRVDIMDNFEDGFRD